MKAPPTRVGDKSRLPVRDGDATKPDTKQTRCLDWKVPADGIGAADSRERRLRYVAVFWSAQRKVFDRMWHMGCRTRRTIGAERLIHCQGRLIVETVPRQAAVDMVVGSMMIVTSLRA